jgi:hypothetical protein
LVDSSFNVETEDFDKRERYSRIAEKRKISFYISIKTDFLLSDLNSKIGDRQIRHVHMELFNLNRLFDIEISLKIDPSSPFLITPLTSNYAYKKETRGRNTGLQDQSLH